MKLVIDSNQIRADALREFLKKSPKNFAVFTDYAAMEAYKGDTLTTIYKSMEIVAEYPSQVIVLKGSQAVCGLRGRSSGLQRRLIDHELSSDFVGFIESLERAKAGNRHIQAQLLEHGREATAHLNKMLKDAQTTGIVIDQIAALYSKEERRVIRAGGTYSPAMIAKITANILTIADTIFRLYPGRRIKPTPAELPNTFIFRVSLCTYLLVLEWAANGGAKNVSPEKLRNDFVDMNFAAYGTYFDGLMTVDAKVLRIHQEARVWLTALFKCTLPGGLFGWTPRPAYVD